MLPFRHHRLEIKILHYCTPSASPVGQLVIICLQCRRPGANPWFGRPPGEGNDNALQYPCWKNLIDSGAWWATVHRVAKSQAQMSD